MLSKRSMEVLRLMIEAEKREEYEDSEIVCDGGICYLGETRISRRTVSDLLRHVALSSASEPGSLERYTVSGTGKKIAEDPAVADRVVAALLAGVNCDESGYPISSLQ